MDRNHLRSWARALIPVVVGLLAATVVAACSSSASSSHVQAAASNASAVATSPAVIHARQQAQVLVITPCKPQLPSVHGFVTCAEVKLGIQGTSTQAKARRGALGSCLFEAGAADHVTTKAGRLVFEQTGAPDCVSQILLAATPSASASAP